jgi:glycosyltransferase involved in cell wall biosynthesis/2-polyprenyl-3-methyl-5-hydroxy-6-metoxy-1,4-benzoquinol methylase
MKLALHFTRYGPYHHARLASARQALKPLGWEVIGLETAGRDATYGWPDGPNPELHTLFPMRVYQSIPARELHQAMTAALDQLHPDAVAIAGWGFPDARAALAWCCRHRARAILMSETRASDVHRIGWKEWAKARLVRRFDAALVGGPAHRDYLVSLGFPAHRIHTGYDVIDNNFFTRASEEIRNQKSARNDLPYFLASNRFIERKNLPFLIRAYHQYATSPHHAEPPWHLCLLGDGPMKPLLLALCRELGLRTAEGKPWEAETASSPPTVYFPGFQPIDALPAFHARAGCFVHPALEEPWGLVLNEAAACALPILASRSTGAAETLVQDGINGWTFDPRDISMLANLLTRVSSPTCPRGELGAASLRLLEARVPQRAFGEGLAKCLTCSSANPVQAFWQTQAENYTGNYADRPRGTNFNFRTRLAHACTLAEGLSGHLLDCACGSGEITHALLQSGRFPRATLVDISGPMLEIARKRMERLTYPVDITWVQDDVFHFLQSQPATPQYDLILCLGLIAHTGRLDELFARWKPRLRPGGRVLLQSTLLEHPGTRLLRAVSSRRHLRLKGYSIHYFRDRDITEAAEKQGLRILQRQRFALAIPYGDRIAPRLNYLLEKRLEHWASRHGAEALYLIGTP